MTDYKIRPATPDDAQRLAHIGVATFIDSYTADIEGEAMMAHCTHQHSHAIYQAYLFDPAAMAWLVESAETGAPIGYAVTCAPDLPIETMADDIELKRIYVLSRFHGSGAGKALMQTVLSHAQAQGAARLLLGTYEDNHRAVAFYSRLGFATVGTRQFQIGNILYDDIVMALNL